MGAPQKREKWQTKTEFIFACLGNAIGLGNLWRFPYLCHESGGGSFVIPYISMLLLCGIPLLYMELSVGQSVGFGPIKSIEKMVPLFRGTGVAMVIISFILCTYYNVIIAWALHYLFASFKSDLPWTHCPVNATTCLERNDTNNASHSNDNIRVTPSQHYFDNQVLKISTGIDNMGSLNGQMFGFLLLAWIMCFICLYKGVKVIGKVAYVTVTLPYLILFVLFVRTMVLPGAGEGLIYYVSPEWNMLLSSRVWLNAAAQIFNSIGIGFGSMIAFASYNPKENNILVDTLCIAITNSLTSIFAGLIVFGALGNMAHDLGVLVPDVVVGGPELVFVTFSNVISQFEFPQIWSALFFLMVFCLGVDSQFAMVEVVITSVKDWISDRPWFAHFNKWIPLFVCVLCFILGIPNVMEGGIYFLTLLDYYTAIISLMFIALFEILAICFIFGTEKLVLMIRSVTKQQPPYAIILCWKYICLYIIIAIFGYSIVTFHPLQYGNYLFPNWANGIGWLITMTSILCIPFCAFHKLLFGQLKNIRTPFKKILLQSITPQLGYLCPDSYGVTCEKKDFIPNSRMDQEGILPLDEMDDLLQVE